jgi:hypothetical protein
MNYGLGNWHDIAENFLKNKSAVECEEHYFGIIYKASERSQEQFESISSRKGESQKINQDLASQYAKLVLGYIERK